MSGLSKDKIGTAKTATAVTRAPADERAAIMANLSADEMSSVLQLCRIIRQSCI